MIIKNNFLEWSFARNVGRCNSDYFLLPEAVSQQIPTSPNITGADYPTAQVILSHTQDLRSTVQTSSCSVWTLTLASTGVKAGNGHWCCHHWAVKDVIRDFHWNSLQKRRKVLVDTEFKVSHLELRFLYSSAHLLWVQQWWFPVCT